MISNQTHTPYELIRQRARDRELTDHEAAHRLIDLSRKSAFRDWQRVGDPGNPGFLNGWTDSVHTYDKWAGEARFNRPWFFRDNWGFIHLRGHAKPPGTEEDAVGLPVFQLPVDLRPELDTYLPSHYGYNVWADDATTYQIADVMMSVRVNGNVQLRWMSNTGAQPLWVTFHNMMFRAANAGSPA